MTYGESYFGNRSSIFVLCPIETGPSILNVEAIMNFIIKGWVVRLQDKHTRIQSQVGTILKQPQIILSQIIIRCQKKSVSGICVTCFTFHSLQERKRLLIGFYWGLRLFVNGYDDGLIFTIKLNIKNFLYSNVPTFGLEPSHSTYEPPKLTT